jgi:hypothetical protein
VVPGRLRPQIFLTFGTTRVVRRQPHALAAFTPRGIPWYSFLEAELTPGHMVPSVATEKIPSATPPGIDPETVRLVAQCLNHYATPDPIENYSTSKPLKVSPEKSQLWSCDTVVLSQMSFPCDVYWIFVLLGCYVGQSGDCLPRFRDNLSVPSLRIKKSNPSWIS